VVRHIYIYMSLGFKRLKRRRQTRFNSYFLREFLRQNLDSFIATVQQSQLFYCEIFRILLWKERQVYLCDIRKTITLPVQ